MLNKILLACCGNKKSEAVARLRVTVTVLDNLGVRGYSSEVGFGALEVIEGSIQVTDLYEIGDFGIGIFQSNLVETVTLENETTGVSVQATYDPTEGGNLFSSATLFEGIEDGQECIVVVYV